MRRPGRAAVPIAIALLAVMAAGAARAETIGLFAPSAPFSGPVARLEFVSALAAKLGAGWNGRAYARAADFAAAVKRGELQVAVVDAAYLAAVGMPYRVLAVAERGGATTTPWEIVAGAGVTDLAGLQGKIVAVPDIGAKRGVFLSEVLLGGEVGLDFFASVVYSPDALSALAAIAHGRAVAAFVPAGLPLPAGTRRVSTLRAVSWPVLVALPGAQAAAPVVAAATRFTSDVFARFVAGGDNGVRVLAVRFARQLPRPPLLTPDVRAAVAALVAGRSFTIPRPDPRTYLLKP